MATLNYANRLNINTGSTDAHPNLAEDSKELNLYSANGLITNIRNGWAIYATYTNKFTNDLGFTELTFNNINYHGVCLSMKTTPLTVGSTYTSSITAYVEDASLQSVLTFYLMMYDSSGTRDTSTLVETYNPNTQAWENKNGGVMYTPADYSMPGAPMRFYVGFKWSQALQNIIDAGGNVCLTIQTNVRSTANTIHMYAPKLSLGLNPYDEWSPAASETTHSGPIKILRPAQRNLLTLRRPCTIKHATSSNATLRGYNEYQMWVGATSNNYVYPSYITNYSVTNSTGTVAVTSTSAAYGLGFPVKCKPRRQYSVSTSAVSAALVQVGWYKADGTFISNTGFSDYTGNTIVYSPYEAEWANVVVRASAANAEGSVTNLQFYEVDDIKTVPTFARLKPDIFYAPDVYLPFMSGNSRACDAELGTSNAGITASGGDWLYYPNTAGPDGVNMHCVEEDVSNPRIQLASTNWGKIFGAADVDRIKPFTITVWLRPTNFDYPQWIFGRAYEDSNKTSLFIYMHTNGVVRVVCDTLSSMNTTTVTFNPGSGNALTVNTWNHIAIGYDGSSWAMLKNGGYTLTTDTKKTTGISDNLSDNMYVFGEPTYATSSSSVFRAWSGQMCDFRLYNKFLSPNEMRNCRNWAISQS